MPTRKVSPKPVQKKVPSSTYAAPLIHTTWTTERQAGPVCQAPGGTHNRESHSIVFAKAGYMRIVPRLGQTAQRSTGARRACLAKSRRQRMLHSGTWSRSRMAGLVVKPVAAVHAHRL